jgi:polar amino acid transport system substrate-binding protein
MKKSVIAAAVIGMAAALVPPSGYTQQFQFEAVPQFEKCGDPSYDKAVKNGITLGISPSPPYSSIDPSTKQASGLDVEINEGALHWMGVNNIRYEVAPFGQLIPNMLSKRIDVVAANIHITPDRLKVVSFSGPAWWYGPAIIVKKGNPENLHSFDDLKGKSIGAIAGSAADEYLRHIGATSAAFQTDAEEFAGVSQGRVPAILEDDVKFLDFLKANPQAPLEMVPNVKIPDELIFKYGYGYARYAFRKEDCSLRVAYTQALSEMRGNGMVSAILKKYGLSNRNLVFFPF